MLDVCNRLAFIVFAVALASAAVLPISVAGAATESVVYSFQNNGTDGNHPQSGLVYVGGNLYGTTYTGGNLNRQCSGPGLDGCGVVFKIDRRTGAETVLYTFCSQANCADGSSPTTNLITVKGTLYAGTGGGGANGSGIVFSLNPATGAESTVYAFCTQTNCADGASVNGIASLYGTLYGVVGGGGANDDGAVFSLNPQNGVETVLHSFCANDTCADGAQPEGMDGPTAVGGNLYGTTTYGGPNGDGTVYKVNPRTGAETVVYSFCSQAYCPDGTLPQSNLINVDGTLWGTTNEGGVSGFESSCLEDADGCGTVFSFNTKTGAETTVYTFCSQANCSDGGNPVAGLINVNGILYGTTSDGGGGNCYYGCGTVFSINARTGAMAVVYSFQGGADGSSPNAGLTDVYGTLYGTTLSGGANGVGTVYKITHP